MIPAVFQTARLIFRPIGACDATAIFDSYAQDPIVCKFLTWQPHSSVEQTKAYVGKCLAAASSQTYVLTRCHAPKLIGCFELRRVASHCLGMGFVLARPSWGDGLMTEALTEVARWALRQGDIWRIGDVCDVDDIASVRVMEKAGLSREGLLRRWAIHPNLGNEPRDCFSFAAVR